MESTNPEVLEAVKKKKARVFAALAVLTESQRWELADALYELHSLWPYAVSPEAEEECVTGSTTDVAQWNSLLIRGEYDPDPE